MGGDAVARALGGQWGWALILQEALRIQCREGVRAPRCLGLHDSRAASLAQGPAGIRLDTERARMQDAMPGPWPARPGSRPSLALPSSPCTRGLPWPRCIHGWLTTSFSSLSDLISPCDFTESSRTRREATWAQSAGSRAREHAAGRGRPHLPRARRRARVRGSRGPPGDRRSKEVGGKERTQTGRVPRGSPRSRVLRSPLLGPHLTPPHPQRGPFPSSGRPRAGVRHALLPHTPLQTSVAGSHRTHFLSAATGQEQRAHLEGPWWLKAS